MSLLARVVRGLHRGAVVKPRFEDGTTGRPLGDDEDLDPRAYDDIEPGPRRSVLGNEPDWADIVDGRA